MAADKTSTTNTPSSRETGSSPNPILTPEDSSSSVGKAQRDVTSHPRSNSTNDAADDANSDADNDATVGANNDGNNEKNADPSSGNTKTEISYSTVRWVNEAPGEEHWNKCVRNENEDTEK